MDAHRWVWALRLLDLQGYRQAKKQRQALVFAGKVVLDEARRTLDLELPRLGISVTITSRLKTADSALHKARRKGLSLDALHDLLGLRIVCEREMDCYRVLHVVHAPWLAVPGEYDDYIARPKGNGYRSLHTAVVSDKGPVFEVQIRSRQMHWEAEQGPAAHWRYQLQRAELILGSQRG